jgi:hypothetical protein
MSKTFTELTTFVVVTCCECHVQFGMTKQHDIELLDEGGNFYCPNGHAQHYTQTTKKQLDNMKRDRDWYARRLKVERADKEAVERSRRAYKGQLTKTKRRVANGVCPCCNRTFADLAQHMRGKHPDYGEEAP